METVVYYDNTGIELLRKMKVTLFIEVWSRNLVNALDICIRKHGLLNASLKEIIFIAVMFGVLPLRSNLNQSWNSIDKY